jgi:integrase
MSTLTPSYDLPQLLAALTALTGPKPVGLDVWREEVTTKYLTRHVNTRNKMAQALRELAQLAGPSASTADLTPALMDRFASRSGAASTTNGLLGSVRAAARIGLKRKYFGHEQLADIAWRIPDRGPKPRRHHSRADVAQVLDSLSARGDDWRSRRLFALASVWAYSGLRKTEALRLQRSDVDLERRFLFVKARGTALKTPGSEAPVPMPDALTVTLKVWAAECGSPWLFPARHRRGPWTGGTAGKRAGDQLRLAGAAAGVAGFTPRSLRHTLATHLTGFWGLSREQVRLILRHTTEATGGYYIHPDLANLRGTVAGFTFG